MTLEHLQQTALDIDLRISKLQKREQRRIEEFEEFYQGQKRRLQEQLSDLLVDSLSVQDMVQKSEDAFESLELQLEALGSVLGEMGIVVDIPARDTQQPSSTPEVQEEETTTEDMELQQDSDEEYDRSDTPTRQYPGSPTLTDLGLSSLTIGLLAENVSKQGKERDSIDSLPAPVLGNMINAHTKTNALVKTITENEFSGLSPMLQGQFTPQYLNTVIYELNEMITDKRFMNDKDVDLFTVQELADASKFSSVRLKSVLEALLALSRVEIASFESEYQYKIKNEL
jgi:hypothetical protein